MNNAHSRESENKEIDFDVIIVGAGPAGLSVASELIKKHKVLVVDARSVQVRGKERLEAHLNTKGVNSAQETQITKSWFCPNDCLYDNPDLLHCRKNTGVTRFLAKTYSGPFHNEPESFDLAWQSQLFENTNLHDQYPYLEEYQLISYWEQKILDADNQSTIYSHHLYQDHHVLEECVEVRFFVKDHAGQKSQLYRCKLLLDASGNDSDIRKAYDDIQEDMYWWSVFGAICTHPVGEIVSTPTKGHPLVVGDYMMWQTFANSNANPQTPVRQGRPIFEYEIFDEQTSFPLILYLRPYKISLERAKAEFLNILQNEPSVQAFKNVQINEFKFGHYPSGKRVQSFAQDRVDFIGDAGLWTTPCGWGASFVLKNYVPYAHKLSGLIEQDSLNKKALRKLSKGHEKKAEFFMNAFITRFLAYGTVAQLDQFIGLFNQIEPVICERIFTLRAEPKDLWQFARIAYKHIQLGALIKAMPKKERMRLLLDLIQVMIQFIQESILNVLGRPPQRGFGIFK